MLGACCYSLCTCVPLLSQAGRTEAELRASLASAEEAAASEGEGRRAAESRAERAEAEAAEAVGELEATKRR